MSSDSHHHGVPKLIPILLKLTLSAVSRRSLGADQIDSASISHNIDRPDRFDRSGKFDRLRDSDGLHYLVTRASILTTPEASLKCGSG